MIPMVSISTTIPTLVLDSSIIRRLSTRIQGIGTLTLLLLACDKYNPIEALMFAGGNLSFAKLLSLISIGINGFVVFGLFFMAVRIARGMKVDNKARSAVWSILVSIFTATSLTLQAIAFDKIPDKGGICDRDGYFPDEWDDKFPCQIYPQYAYFKFFHDCSSLKK